jgi:hypothetical protein
VTGIVARAFAWGVENNVIKANPFARLKRPPTTAEAGSVGPGGGAVDAGPKSRLAARRPPVPLY